MDGTTAATIPIRDANGRMQAADPASGATDKTLVTANWVSQTGDSGPNNLIHKSGNETKNGMFGLIGNNNYLDNKYNFDCYAVPASDRSFDIARQKDQNDVQMFRFNGFKMPTNITCIQDDLYHHYTDANNVQHYTRFRMIYELSETTLRQHLLLIKDGTITQNIIVNQWTV